MSAAGTTPSSDQACEAAISTSSQSLNALSSDQMALISGREYLGITSAFFPVCRNGLVDVIDHGSEVVIELVERYLFGLTKLFQSPGCK